MIGWSPAFNPWRKVMSPGGDASQAARAESPTFSREMSVLWYSRYLPVIGPLAGHFEVESRGKMFQPFGGYSIVREPFDMERVERDARAGRRRGFVKFTIGIDPQEDERTATKIAQGEGKYAAQVCTSGTWHVLDQLDGDFHVPFPFRWTPGLGALYLSVQYLAGNPRVKRIETFGDASLKDLLVAVPAEVAGFAVAAGALAYLTAALTP